MHRRLKLAVLALLPFALLGSGKTDRATADDKLDKKVLEIVKQTGALYKSAKTMQAEGTFETKGEQEDPKAPAKATAIYRVEKPSKLYVTTQLGGNPKTGPDIFVDSKKMIVYRKALNQYIERDNPGSLADVGLSLLQIGPGTVGMLFANILAEDPGDLLMQGVNSCSYVGTEKVDGVAVHRMKFSQDEFDWELWVASEGKPLVVRMISTRMGPNGKITTTETYKNWKLDFTPEKATFLFTLPENAKKVEHFDQ